MQNRATTMIQSGSGAAVAADVYPELGLLIDGRWLKGDGRDTRSVTSPATGDALGQLPIATGADVDAAIAAAYRAFGDWRCRTALERGRILQRIAQAIRADVRRLATIITLEQGKTLTEAQAEVEGTADSFEWMAEEGRRAYGRVVPSRHPGMEQLVVLEPVGPVAALSPWNYPAILTGRKIASALAAGCTVVAKSAEETPGIIVALAGLCAAAGLPAGVLNLVFGVPADISTRLIDDPRIGKISFTGSVPVGRQLAARAGAALKRITLELGGHSAVIVDADADIERAASLAVTAKFRNAGQTCHCPTRFYVQRTVFASFADQFVARARALRVGDGFDPATQMGPVLAARRIAALRDLVDDARGRGSEIACGGTTLQEAEGRGGGGSYWMPTVILSTAPECRALTEEPFGPLAMIQPFDTLDDAIAQANGTRFGLAAYAFTRSQATAQRLQTDLAAGSVSINSFAMAAPEMPFGGIRDSGLGSEMGNEGLLSHFHVKAVSRAFS